MTDLANVKPAELLHDILHPGTGKPIGVRVGLLSIDDPKVKKVKTEIDNKRISLERRGKGFTSEQIDANTNRILFAAMTHWEWIKDANGEQATFNGEVPPFNEQSVSTVFEALPWFRNDIMNKVGEEKDFFTR